MPCYSPIHGWYSREKTEKGKRKFVFSPTKAYDSGHQVTIPCGVCIGCKLERSRQWAMRCVYESELHERNCFITLTYDDSHLSDDSLHVDHFQKFMKRLRKAYPEETIRYYHCGEYGDQNGRPHYHACIFGFDFPDKELWSIRSENRLYTSKSLNEIWGKGYAIIGEVTFESAAYVARYINKKLLGASDKTKEDHYRGRLPEYTTMSRRPGIGSQWYKKYRSDVYPHDYVVVRDKKMKPPKFFDTLLEKEDPEMYKAIKMARQDSVPELTPSWLRLQGRVSNVVDSSPERLQVRQTVKKAEIKTLKREL